MGRPGLFWLSLADLLLRFDSFISSLHHSPLFEGLEFHPWEVSLQTIASLSGLSLLLFYVYTRYCHIGCRVTYSRFEIFQVLLFGGQVISWKNERREELLYMSTKVISNQISSLDLIFELLWWCHLINSKTTWALRSVASVPNYCFS